MFGSLWLALLLPILFMPIVYYTGRTLGKKVSWVALIPLLYTTLYLSSLVGKVSTEPIGEYFYWLPGIRFGLINTGVPSTVIGFYHRVKKTQTGMLSINIIYVIILLLAIVIGMLELGGF